MTKLIFSLSPSESLDFSLKGNLTRMGRDAANDIVINNSWISAFHAEFRRVGSSLTVYDLDSSNGTSVNGQRITKCVLKNGDIIAFGHLEAIYESAVPAQQLGAALGSNGSTPPPPPGNLAPLPKLPPNPVRPPPSLQAPEATAAPATAGTGESIMAGKPPARPGAVYGIEPVRHDDLPGLQNPGPGATGAGSALPDEFASSSPTPTSQKRSMEQALTQTRTELSVLETSLTTAKAELAQLQASLRDTHHELLQAQEASRSAKSQLEDHQGEQVRFTKQSEAMALALAKLCGEDRIVREKIAAETVQAHDALMALKATTQSLASEAELMRAEAAQFQAQSAGWAAKQEQAAAELAALQGDIHQAKETTGAGDRKIAVRLKALHELEARHTMLSSKIAAWEIQNAAGESQAAACTANHSALQEQIRSMESKLAILRQETEGSEAVSAFVSDLRRQQAKAERRLEILTDRLAGIRDAPDPNWGTVHALARSFIKHLDLVDDLIEHLTEQGGGGEILIQLQIFQSGMVDTLKEYSVESFTFEAGALVDIAARKRISIVESMDKGGHDGTQVVRTYRPGYLCSNGEQGLPTLLRKAEVAVSMAVDPAKGELAPH